MLVGTTLEQRTASFLEDVVKLPQTFYLTGSRYFGYDNESSDWDFFVEHSKEVMDLLKQKYIFHEDSWGHSYCGNDTVVVLKGYERGGRYTPIHIQLVKNAELKNKIQIRLKETNFVWPMDKGLRKVVWDTAFNIAQAFWASNIDEETGRLCS